MYYPGSKDQRFAGVSSDDMVAELLRRCDGYEDNLIKFILGVEDTDIPEIEDPLRETIRMAKLIKAAKDYDKAITEYFANTNRESMKNAERAQTRFAELFDQSGFTIEDICNML